MGAFWHVFAFFRKFCFLLMAGLEKRLPEQRHLLMPGDAAIFAACGRQSASMPMILDAICSETPLFTLSSLIYSRMIWPEAI